MSQPKIEEGCELCGDFPVILAGRCHPSAPVRVVMLDAETLEIRCYLPECDRHITTLKVKQ